MDSSLAISNPERWCCESVAFNMLQIWKTQQWPQDWKRSVFIPKPKKGNAKEYSNYHTIALISAAAAAAKSLQSCPILCNPMDCSLPGFSIHGILQARTCVRWVQLCSSLSILWHCLSLGSEWKLTFSSPVRRGGKNTQKNCTKKISMTQITTMVWSLS